jgi:sugar phosphate isomerase/epimerase
MSATASAATRNASRKTATSAFLGSTLEYHDFFTYASAAALVFGTSLPRCRGDGALLSILTLRPDTGPTDWKPALDAGAALGARTLSVGGADPDRSRLADTLAALTDDARPLGLRPTLEPISYQAVSTVAEAAALASGAGAALLLDALHVQRGGSSIDDVRVLDPDLVPCVQLCDGPLAAPTQLDLPAELPLGMSADGSVLQVEARVQRKLVGEGELPLAELVAAAPAGTPLSVEVPHAVLQARLSDVDFARRNLRAIRALLGGTRA